MIQVQFVKTAAFVSNERVVPRAYYSELIALLCPLYKELMNVTAHTAQQVQHVVCCPYCGGQFDLFAAYWCEHLEGQASKVCPFCVRCVCEHPAYAEPHFWKEASTGFQKQGFRRLFLFYL